jgi:pyruvate,water dikinase
VTTVSDGGGDDTRAWYRSLHRSYENLQALRGLIEGRHIPAMIREAASMGETDLSSLDPSDLAAETARRRQRNEHWVKVYWEDFIPFAHGIRLFGQIYNDAVRPENPYEFLELLADTPMEGLERNRMLESMAEAVRNDGSLRRNLEERRFPGDSHPFTSALQRFIRRFGDLSCSTGTSVQCAQGPEALVHVLLEMADHPPAAHRGMSAETRSRMVGGYLDRFPPERRPWARDLLDLARTSYRLRDDDNLHLGRIEAGVRDAEAEIRRRLTDGRAPMAPGDRDRLQALLTPAEPAGGEGAGDVAPPPPASRSARVRQIVGQPAGPGIARGPARVVTDPEALLSLRRGEVLVCDAVDPNMTWSVPLAAAVVERRGGMLIHGAIIAREYGLPCVTGVVDATTLLRTGDKLTVDGFLGIVTVG